MTDLIILSTLLGGAKHGYQLKREAGIILGQSALHNNLVYPLLRRFMNAKWVSRRTVPGERGQTRHLYAITALGRKELLSKLNTFSAQEARSADEFRFRVGMFQMVNHESRVAILDSREKFLMARMEKLKAVEANFPLDHYASEVTQQFRSETQSELDWIKRLRKLQNDPR